MKVVLRSIVDDIDEALSEAIVNNRKVSHIQMTGKEYLDLVDQLGNFCSMITAKNEICFYGGHKVVIVENGIVIDPTKLVFEACSRE